MGSRLTLPALAFAALLAFAAALPARAQTPSDSWRTLETASFRFHYPAEAEAFARRTASRMEAVRAAVAREVGYRPPGRTEVLIEDPLARANGSAWPVLTAPRMILYTTPPPADSVLGNYRDWGEVLTVHEEVHLAHLLRPSRNPRRHLLESLAPLGPIAQRSPLWVSEGYATLLEGRLTGWGRPHGSLRAALLRRWAQAGALPSYGALSGAGGRYLGRSTPYLVGSAFLEWLEEDFGHDALRHLWRRMSAVESRGFEAAWIGVFEESPARLYNRFCAELTFRAMLLEQEIEPRLEQGELFEDLSWRPSAPALDPSGERLAVVVRRGGEPSRLLVLSTADDPEAAVKLEEGRAQTLARDPEDVASRWPKTPPRRILHALETRHGRAPFAPRWGPRGEWILFHRFSVDPGGDRRADLFRWWPESDRFERVTRLADVRSGDPAPSGEWAVALRHRWGTSQLVRVDLASGEVTPISEASAERVYDQPRVSPDGARLLYLVQQGDGWRLAVRPIDPALGGERLLPIEIDGRPVRSSSHPAWSRSGEEIVLSLGLDGFIDLFAIRPDFAAGARSRGPRRLTRTHGAALAPEPSPDGTVFFLSLESDGFDLRRVRARRSVGPPLVPGPTWSVERRRELVPAVAPPAPAAAPLEAAALSPSEPYGAGPGEWLPLVGGSATDLGSRLEAGARYGDLIGRWNLVALGAAGGVGVRGAAVAGVWRGFTLDLEGRVFAMSRAERAEAGEIERRGLELALADSGGGDLWRWRWRLGGLAEAVETGGGDLPDEDFSAHRLFAGFSSRWRQSWGAFRLSERVGAGVAIGESAGDGWQRGDFSAGLTASYSPRGSERARLGLGWRRGRVESATFVGDLWRLGGVDDSLTPRSVAATALYAPALPDRIRIGERAEHQRVEIGAGLAGGVSFFGERFRLWNEGEARPEWLRLLGVTYRLESLPLPLLALPGARLEAGAAVLLDPPFEDDVRGWLTVRWSP